ncbi:MAG: M24 family metallopeptidase [Clostridia bacterium]
MDKIAKLRDQFASLGIDGMLITSAQNRRYFTGFTGTAGVVLISATESRLVTDYRYADQAKQQAAGYEVVKHTGNIFAETAAQAKSMGINRLGFEQEHLTFGHYRKYDEQVKAELVPTSGVIEGFRMFKSAEEQAAIRTAAQIADAAFAHICGYIRPGITELDVANELEMFMRKQGATSSAFDTIVASGYRSALPHGVASSKEIASGEMVTLDFGAYYKGYRSDMTRTVAVGEPGEELRRVYAIVLESLTQALAGMKPGVTAKEADAFMRDVIVRHGYEELSGSGTGHGIGLDIHEEPFFSVAGTKLLAPGMIVTVEPGIYLPGLGGVRIEDDILIIEGGNEVLTHSPKELILL